jgi:hypothetical protein
MNEEVKEVQPQPDPTPFFVRFLEQQEALAVQTGVKAGRTLKYPSAGSWGADVETPPLLCLNSNSVP